MEPEKNRNSIGTVARHLETSSLIVPSEIGSQEATKLPAADSSINQELIERLVVVQEALDLCGMKPEVCELLADFWDGKVGLDRMQTARKNGDGLPVLVHPSGRPLPDIMANYQSNISRILKEYGLSRASVIESHAPEIEELTQVLNSELKNPT